MNIELAVPRRNFRAYDRGGKNLHPVRLDDAAIEAYLNRIGAPTKRQS
jgi:hypothetical protein